MIVYVGGTRREGGELEWRGSSLSPGDIGQEYQDITSHTPLADFKLLVNDILS